MAAEKSLLQRIREKELELSVKLDLVRRVAEERIRTGQEEAAQILQTAERESARESEEVFRKEMEGVQKEIGEMRERAQADADREGHRGEGNLERAVEKIVHHVTLE